MEGNLELFKEQMENAGIAAEMEAEMARMAASKQAGLKALMPQGGQEPEKKMSFSKTLKDILKKKRQIPE